MLVDNSHTLYIINHSILFLIIIHTVTYHTNTQSLQLSCLCLLFHNTLRYLIVSFSIFSFSSHTVSFYYFIFLHTIFQIPYSPSPSFKSLIAPLHLPLSSPYKVHSMYAGTVGPALPKAPHLSLL